jgi:hypothetical protein
MGKFAHPNVLATYYISTSAPTQATEYNTRLGMSFFQNMLRSFTWLYPLERMQARKQAQQGTEAATDGPLALTPVARCSQRDQVGSRSEPGSGGHYACTRKPECGE